MNWKIYAMCLGKVIVTASDGEPREITDVVDVVMEGGHVKIATLFGEQHDFAGVSIEHIAMRSGVVISLALRQ
jgi:predicted RNA-binding protein